MSVFLPTVCLSTVELAPPPDNKDKICRSELLDPAAPGHDSTVAESSEGGVFTGKRFLLVGFSVEAEAQLSMLVVENYGKVLVGRFRGVADYAVVPLLGCEVEATVDEVVTDTWLVRQLFIIGVQYTSNQHTIISDLRRCCLFAVHKIKKEKP